MQSPWQSSTLVLEVHDGTKNPSTFQNYAEEHLSQCNTCIGSGILIFLLNFRIGKHGPKSLFHLVGAEWALLG